MGTTQSNNLAQTPNNTPIADKDTGRVNFIWNQWFTNVQIKLNTITAAIIALSKNATAGFLSSDGAGGIFARTLTPGTGITITNGSGVAGNPVISASATGGAPINIVNNTSTSYTVQATDLPSTSSNVGWVVSNVASANSIYVDIHVNQAIPIGGHLYVSEEGSGTTTIKGLAGVTFVGATITGVAKGVGELVQIATNTWHVFGNLAYLAFAATTWNPSDKSSNLTLSGGNLVATNVASNVWSAVRGTNSYVSGKYYFEVLIRATSGNIMPGVALAAAPLNNFIGSDTNGWGYDGINGYKYHVGTGTSFGSTYTSGDIIGIAVDISSGFIWFSKNNTWQASGNPSTGTNPAFTGVTGTIFPAGSTFDPSSSFTGNFTTLEQTYTPPTGFTSWG